MLRLRRNDHAPRVEMTPLIDVVFLLLTFFMYAMLVMWPVQVMPVAISALADRGAATPVELHTLVLDREARLSFDKQSVSLETLDVQLAELRARVGRTQVFVVLETGASADRGPLLLEVMAHVDAAGHEPVLVTQKQP